MYQGIFDADFDKYTGDAVTLFTTLAAMSVFENLVGLPEDWQISPAALTPSLLRLAYRRGTSARAFLRRLRTMTSPMSGTGIGKIIPFNQLHGVEEVKCWAMDLKADLARYRQGQLAWRELSRGLLLAGAPGTGKTTLAASIAGYCGVAFVATSYAAWQRSGNGHLGDVLKAMAASFAEARALVC